MTCLSSGIYDLGRVLLVLVLDRAGEGVFDGGVVAFDKVILNELDSEGGFAYTFPSVHCSGETFRPAAACARRCWGETLDSTYRQLWSRRWRSCVVWDEEAWLDELYLLV